MKNLFFMIVILPMYVYSQHKDLIKKKLNVSISAGTYAPFVQTYRSLFSDNMPNTVTSPKNNEIFNWYTYIYSVISYKNAWSVSANLDYRIWEVFYLKVEANYIRTIWNDDGYSDSLLTFNGHWLKHIESNRSENNLRLPIGLEYRPTKWFLFSIGFLNEAYSGCRLSYRTPELISKHTNGQQWKFQLFKGQYLDITIRPSKWPHLYLYGRILHFDSMFLLKSKRSYSYSMGCEFL